MAYDEGDLLIGDLWKIKMVANSCAKDYIIRLLIKLKRLLFHPTFPKITKWISFFEASGRWRIMRTFLHNPSHLQTNSIMKSSSKCQNYSSKMQLWVLLLPTWRSISARLMSMRAINRCQKPTGTKLILNTLWMVFAVWWRKLWMSNAGFAGSRWGRR